jgi:hypothetical protein
MARWTPPAGLEVVHVHLAKAASRRLLDIWSEGAVLEVSSDCDYKTPHDVEKIKVFYQVLIFFLLCELVR